MSLVGWPLILLTAAAAAVAGTGTVLGWRRLRRLRPVVRTTGVLLTELLLVLTAALVVNRHERFFPSWQALSGDVGPGAVTAAARAGRLDAVLRGSGAAALPWKPGGTTAQGATVVVPAGYKDSGRAYPVLVVLSADAAAHAVGRAADAVTLLLRPGPGAPAAALAALVDPLEENLRVTPAGWAVLADDRYAAAAGRLVGARPGRYRAAVLVGGAAPAGPRPPAVAVVRETSGPPTPRGTATRGTATPAPSRGPAAPARPSRSAAPAASATPGWPRELARPQPLDPTGPGRPATPARPGGPPATAAVVVLTAPRRTAWTVAATWAVGQVPPSLAAPLRLPTTPGPGR